MGTFTSPSRYSLNDWKLAISLAVKANKKRNYLVVYWPNGLCLQYIHITLHLFSLNFTVERCTRDHLAPVKAWMPSKSLIINTYMYIHIYIHIHTYIHIHIILFKKIFSHTEKLQEYYNELLHTPHWTSPANILKHLLSLSTSFRTHIHSVCIFFFCYTLQK